MSIRKRVGIIGAGPGGLSQLLAFEKTKDPSIDLVCFDRQADWGGTWIYTSCTGLDEYCEPVHSSMYRGLWSNGPKETIEFQDYTFEEHFGQLTPSFPPRAVILDYLLGRAKKGNIRKFIRFRTAVRWVDFDEANDQFLVRVEGLVNKTIEDWSFDYVVVASGHYQCPNMPDFQGMSEFPGRVLHAHDFRGGDEFANQRLLLIGASDSAEDIAIQCLKFGARSIVISYRTRPLGIIWPEGIREVPLLRCMNGKKAHFKDGTSEEFDAVIFCTGYRHSYPFIADSFRLDCADACLYPPLYKGIFWMQKPRLIYLGMQAISLLRLDIQANLVRDYVLGTITLPGLFEMKNSVDQWCLRVDRAKTCFELYLELQRDYLQDILLTCAPHTAPSVEVEKLFAIEMDVERARVLNVLTYRDKSYQSIYTNALAPEPHTTWLQNMDDSIDGYLIRTTENNRKMNLDTQ